MGEIITLRTHHLGEIYEIFAVLLSKDNSNKGIITNLIKMKVDDYLGSESYPEETSKKLHDVLNAFFFGDIFVVFEEGPDVICNAGCLLFNKQMIVESDNDHVKIAKTMTIMALCENKTPKEDVRMEEIFGLEKGRKYKKIELEEKIKKVFQKHKKIYWKRLIENESN